jgi:hypothetical protein
MDDGELIDKEFGLSPRSGSRQTLYQLVQLPSVCATELTQPTSLLISRGEELTMPEKNDFDKIFARLKKILQPYVKKMDVASDSETYYLLNTRHIMKNKQPLCFAGVRCHLKDKFAVISSLCFQ